MFTSFSQQSVDGLLASYNLPLIIVKKRQAIVEKLILSVVKGVLNTVLHHKACFSVITSIPFSNDIV